jgi:hypothetical protein
MELRNAGICPTLTIAVLLAGGGGDDEGREASSDPTAAVTSTRPEETTGATIEAFCADVEAAEEALRKFSADRDPTDIDAAIQDALEVREAFRSVEPPAEIAHDWAAVVSFFDVMASMEDLDTNDPAAVTERLDELGTQLDDKGEEVGAAGMRVEAYVKDECGITLE